MNSLFAWSEFWSAIVGALVGAIAGGIIAYLVQIKTIREGRADRAEERKLVQPALANSLLFKMMRIHSDLLNIHRHIEDCYAFAEKEKLGGEPWSFVTPIANPPPHVHFTSEEMGMLLAQKDKEVLNAMLPMDEIHNSVVETAVLYRDHRATLTERLPAPHSFEGAKLVGGLSKEQLLGLRPYMVNTNSLVEQLRVNAARDTKEADEVLNRLHALLKERGLVAFSIERK